MVGTERGGQEHAARADGGAGRAGYRPRDRNGRIGALLELGAGFHPDLTGRENIWVNASLIGLTRRRTARAVRQIVEFAGIGDFIDEPLRTYSSGMIMRLAFSVAVHMDPDILIIDEVLAVGDHAFQAKCRAKILQFRRAGKTLLCVSHAAAGMQELCERAIWLDRGVVVHGRPAGGGGGRLRGPPAGVLELEATASMSRGPRSRIAASNCAANSDAVAARVAATPIPSASFTQSSSGRPMSIIPPAAVPRRHPAALHLDPQHAVAAVGQDHADYVEPLAGHGPQRLQGVHAAAVAFERDHLAIGARQCRARRRAAIPDRWRHR